MDKFCLSRMSFCSPRVVGNSDEQMHILIHSGFGICVCVLQLHLESFSLDEDGGSFDLINALMYFNGRQLNKKIGIVEET